MKRRTLAFAIALAVTACGQGVDLGTPDSPESSSETTDTTASAPTTVTSIDTGAAEPASTTTTTSSAASSDDPSDEEAAPMDDDATVPAALMDQILEDAAARTGVSVDDLVVVRAEAVTWSDGALGCPEPGVLYTQALVDGFWIEIDANGDLLDYRATARGGFRLCEEPATEGDASSFVVTEPPSKGGEPVPIDPPTDPNT